MYPQVFLVLCLFLSSVVPFSINNSPVNNDEGKSTNVQSNLPLSENQQKMNDVTKESKISPAEMTEETTEAEKATDLTGQESFYPSGGIWWGVRPWGGWGGWGGYRPWYGWGRPHWGGHWGAGNWAGGHLGGGRWG